MKKPFGKGLEGGTQQVLAPFYSDVWAQLPPQECKPRAAGAWERCWGVERVGGQALEGKGRRVWRSAWSGQRAAL